jgi:hypothetical protein
MEDRETARMRKYGESKTARIMMTTAPHVTSGLGLRKFQADGFLLTRVHICLLVYCPLFLSDFTWKLNLLGILSINTKIYNFVKILQVGTELFRVDRHTEERADRHGEIDSRFFVILRTRPTNDNSVNVIEFCAVYILLNENWVFRELEETEGSYTISSC